MRTIILVSILLWVAMACNGPRKITEKGLSYAKLGNPMPDKGISEWAGIASRDTLYDQGGYQWRALILSYANGEVFVEEDFGQQGTINRIRIESPELTVGKKRFVGMSWEELQAQKNNWDAIFLLDYGVWDVISASQGRIHYLLEEKRDTTAFDINLGVKSILPDAKVTAIVVM